MNVLRKMKWLAALGLLAMCSTAQAVVGLSLVSDQPAYLSGATVTVRVQMDASVTEVWGGQFFLAYNPANLTFVSATPGDAPFTQQIYSSATSPNIDYVVGAPNGTLNGATTMKTLAVLKFTATAAIGSTPGLVSFRAHTPPTRLTDNVAMEVASTTTDLSAISISAFGGNPTYADDNYVGLPNGTTVNFPDNGLPGPHAIGVDAFATIGGATTAVSSCGQTFVAAGAYNENVTVTKPFTLKGPQATFDARGRVGAEAVWTPAVATTAQLTISYNGASFPLCAMIVDGLTFSGGSAGTQGCIYNNVGQNPGMQFINNRFIGYSTQAIWLNRGGNDITIDKNVMDGTNIAGGTQVIFLNTQAFNGLWITNNNIVNNPSRYGLFVDGDHNVGESATRGALISGNLFNNNLQGMNLGKRAFGTLGTPVLGTYAGTISNNTISNHAFDGIQGGIQHVLVTRNTFTSNARWGLNFSPVGGVGPSFGGQNSVATENFFSGNGVPGSPTTTGDVVFSAAQTAGTISTNHLNGNSLGSSTAVAYSGTETIDCSGNWWGNATGPTLATHPAGTGNTIQNSGSSHIDFTPWLNSGTDTDLVTAGFQGDFSYLHVDDDSVQFGTTGRVSEAVGYIADGSLTGGSRIIKAEPGTYQENPVVNRAVTISGPNAGTAGSAARAPEATIVTNGSQTSVVSITSSNVTIDGMFLEGDDSAVTGAALTGSGNDANVSYGVRPSSNQSGITLRNSIVKHAAMAFRGDGSSTGNLITRNWFDDIGFFDFGYAVSLRTEYYADVTDNKMTRVWSALHTNNFHNAGAPASWSFSGNEVNSYAGGVLNWLQYGSARSLTIDNNTFTAEAGAVANNSAIEFITIQDGVTPTVTNNTISGYDYGVIFANCAGTTPITLGSTNSIAGAKKAGVYLSNNVSFNAVGTTLLNVGGYTQPVTVNIVGLPVTGTLFDGLVVNADTGVTNPQPCRMNITNDTHVAGTAATGSGVKVIGALASASVIGNQLTFTGFANGALVDGGKALFENNNFTGNSFAGIKVQNGATVDAGDCSGSNFTGIGTGSGTAGSSAGNNNLTGYGFDNTTPWAIYNDNSSVQPDVYAQNNAYGATILSIGTLVFDNADNAAKSTVLYSQSGGQGITAAVASNDYCNYSVPASVTFTATYAGPGTIEWHDGTCTGSLLGSGNPFLWTSPPSAPGVHTYFARLVNDGCAVECASTTITVHAAPVITANIELNGVVAGPFTRCITFDFFTSPTCPLPTFSHEETVTFSGGTGSVVFVAPCGSYTCVTARDRLHTLRRTSDGMHFIPSGNDYTLNFTGTKALLGGNVNDDNFIDILDFGGYIGKFGLPDAATTCATTGIHPDFSGSGDVGIDDYTFISSQFLFAREPDCCSNPLSEGTPTLEIPVIELARRDYEMARTADLNRDGILNTADVAFLGQHGFARCPADFYADGSVNVQDIFIFLDNWFGGFPAADFNDDHATGVNDVFEFLNVWFQGC